MDETFRWFTAVDLTEYEDKYVSIVNKKVVCADEEPEVVYLEAKKKYPDKEIVLWKVPRGETSIRKTRRPYSCGRDESGEVSTGRTGVGANDTGCP